MLYITHLEDSVHEGCERLAIRILCHLEDVASPAVDVLEHESEFLLMRSLDTVLGQRRQAVGVAERAADARDLGHGVRGPVLAHFGTNARNTSSRNATSRWRNASSTFVWTRHLKVHVLNFVCTRQCGRPQSVSLGQLSYGAINIFKSRTHIQRFKDGKISFSKKEKNTKKKKTFTAGKRLHVIYAAIVKIPEMFVKKAFGEIEHFKMSPRFNPDVSRRRLRIHENNCTRTL